MVINDGNDNDNDNDNHETVMATSMSASSSVSSTMSSLVSEELQSQISCYSAEVSSTMSSMASEGCQSQTNSHSAESALWERLFQLAFSLETAVETGFVSTCTVADEAASFNHGNYEAEDLVLDGLPARESTIKPAALSLTREGSVISSKNLIDARKASRRRLCVILLLVSAFIFLASLIVGWSLYFFPISSEEGTPTGGEKKLTATKIATPSPHFKQEDHMTRSRGGATHENYNNTTAPPTHAIDKLPPTHYLQASINNETISSWEVITENVTEDGITFGGDGEDAIIYKPSSAPSSSLRQSSSAAPSEQSSTKPTSSPSSQLLYIRATNKPSWQPSNNPSFRSSGSPSHIPMQQPSVAPSSMVCSTIYITARNGKELATLDSRTGTYQDVGSFMSGDIRSLALTGSERALYGIYNTKTRDTTLTIVDPTTAIDTAVGVTTMESPVGLSSNSRGRLFAASSSLNLLYSINRFTALSEVVARDLPPGIVDLAFDSEDTLYAITEVGELFILSTSNDSGGGASSRYVSAPFVGTLPSENARVAAIMFNDQDNLFAVLQGPSSLSIVYEINLHTMGPAKAVVSTANLKMPYGGDFFCP